MKIIYVDKKGRAVPCIVTKTKIIPQIKGGYRLLRLAGFETNIALKKNRVQR